MAKRTAPACHRAAVAWPDAPRRLPTPSPRSTAGRRGGARPRGRGRARSSSTSRRPARTSSTPCSCRGSTRSSRRCPFTPGHGGGRRRGAVGDGVDRVAVGDRVLARLLGGYASQVVLPAAGDRAGARRRCRRARPPALVQSYATMLFALTRRTSVAPGEWVAVLGAGGGIGLATVDLAKALGRRVVACASSRRRSSAAAAAAGADATIAYDDDGVDLKAAIREATGGGADVVVDPIGGAEGRGRAAGAAVDGPLRRDRLRRRRRSRRCRLNQVLLNNRTVVGVDWGAWTFRDPAGNAALLAELLDHGRPPAAPRRSSPVPYPLDRAARGPRRPRGPPGHRQGRARPVSQSARRDDDGARGVAHARGRTPSRAAPA